MADDKNKTGQQDRSQVSGSEEYEIQYFKDKLGVTKQEVLDAIKATGSNNREVLTDFLTKNKK